MKKIAVNIVSFSFGAIVLCFFATLQKMSIGAPLVIEGYVVPFVFGGSATFLLRMWIAKLREARSILQKSYGELEISIDERTRELRIEIEERKRIEQELRDSEERYRSLSDASFEGIVITENGRIIEANAAVSKIFGYALSEILGVMATDLISPEERENVKSKMLSGYELPYETSCLGKDGSVFPIEVHAKGFNYKGKQVRVTAVRDLTEQKKAEKEIITLRGILPICASCKKIRDSRGYWNQIESYISAHSEAEFSHSICQECAKTLYPDFVDEEGNI